MTDATPFESESLAAVGGSVDPQSVEGIFLAALAQSGPDERAALLDELCAGDSVRRLRVEALLRAYEDAGSFLESPARPRETRTTSLDFLTPADDPGLLGKLGEYEVYEIIGQGGMGIVFRARDPRLNRVVAIKVMAPELAANPNARRRFIREAQAAAAVSHPHVVTIHAVDDGNPLPYLVMECVVGQSLQQKLDKVGALRLAEILRIGKQIAEGLSAAHKQGLIHRDIKPANILLENGVERVKITDFGLARAVDDVSVTRTGEVTGTPQFMSPEQASGERVDHRGDLFSLGCVMYAMCTGRSPFRATSLAAAIKRVCHDEPRDIAEINPELPDWLIGIVFKLLAKSPDDRFQTADELVLELERRLADLQSLNSTATPTRRIGTSESTYFSTKRSESGRTPSAVLQWWSLPMAILAGILCGAILPPPPSRAVVSFVVLGTIGAGLMLGSLLLRFHGKWNEPESLRSRVARSASLMTAFALSTIWTTILQLAKSSEDFTLIGSFILASAIAFGLMMWLLWRKPGVRRSPVAKEPVRWTAGQTAIWFLAVPAAVFFLLAIPLVGLVLWVLWSDYRMLRAPQAAVVLQDVPIRSMNAMMPGSTNTIPPTPSDTASEPEMGGVIVNMPFSDRIVWLIPDTPHSPFDSGKIGFNKSETRQLPAGTYTIVYQDHACGWLDLDPGVDMSDGFPPISGTGGDMMMMSPGGSFGGSSDSGMGMMMGSGGGTFEYGGTWYGSTFALYPGGKVTVTPGEFQVIAADRDIALIRAHHPSWEPGKFHRLLWNGQVFTLTADQGRVFSTLLSFMKPGWLSVSEQALLDELAEQSQGEFPPQGKSLRQIFNHGEHPAWGKLFTVVEDELRNPPNNLVFRPSPIQTNDPETINELRPADPSPNDPSEPSGEGVPPSGDDETHSLPPAPPLADPFASESRT